MKNETRLALENLEGWVARCLPGGQWTLCKVGTELKITVDGASRMDSENQALAIALAYDSAYRPKR
jgi:hypothetical protein